MLLTVFTLLATIYLLVCAIGYLLARITIQDKELRKLFVILGFLVPPIAVWAIIKTCSGHIQPFGYSEELARIEDEIEAERVAIFGGKPLKPSFSENWKVAYLRLLAKAAKKVESFIGSRRHLRIDAAKL